MVGTVAESPWSAKRGASGGGRVGRAQADEAEHVLSRGVPNGTSPEPFARGE